MSALVAGTLAGVCHAGDKRPTPPKAATQASAQGADSAQSIGYIAVPDLEALIAHVEATANVVAPGSMPPGTAKAGLALKLGESGLAGLAGKPIVLLLLKAQGPMAPPQPVLFLPVPVKDAKTYETALAGFGWKTRTAPGLLIAASTPEALAASRSVESEYRRITAAAIPHDLRVSLQMGRLMEAYGPMLQMGMDAAMAKAGTTAADAEKRAPQKPGAPPSTAATAKFMKLYTKGMLAVLGQLDDVQWDIDLQPDAFSSDTVVTAKAGSALADLARMAPAESNRAAALLSGSGFMTAAYQLDPIKLSTFVSAIVKESAADPEAAELLTPEVSALVEQMGAAYAGQAAYRMAAAPGTPLAVETVMSVTDEARAMALVEKGLSLIGPGGGWGTLLKDTGVSMALQKNARRHAGVPVHRLKVKVDTKGLTAEQKATQATFMRDTEFAITRGYYLSAQDPAGLDRLIDRASSGAAAEGITLMSARAYGAGRHAYVDYDFIGLMRAVSALTPPVKGQPNPFASLPATTADPMLSAMTFGEGRIRWQSKIPLRPFVLMTEAFKKAAPSPAPSPSPR